MFESKWGCGLGKGEKVAILTNADLLREVIDKLHRVTYA
ncbi:hypothetical protein DOT_1236 [Desulfosporosinus sp. OT]|nr:hypothetical protein DOT_1236 [Desulfosporosinus sp. OT]